MKHIARNFFGMIALLALVLSSVARAQDAYTLSPGDEVSIVVFGQADLSVDIKLDENGTLNYPLLGAVSAGGLTASQLEKTITRELSGSYLVDPDVRVSVADTLDKAVALAGGFSESASKERVTLTRIINGQSQLFSMRPTDAVLPGDIIEIGEYLQIFINGEVQRPGNYAYQPGLTLEKTIALSGGFTGRASRKRIEVSRDVDGQQRQGRIRMTDPVYPGDIVTVKQGFF